MTDQSIETPRESFMEAAQREMIAFERKEREFRRRKKRERAEELHVPELKQVLDRPGGRLDHEAKGPTYRTHGLRDWMIDRAQAKNTT